MKQRELVIAEVPKNKSDAFRVSISSLREGRVVRVTQVHRYAGGQVEVPGKAITFRTDQLAAMIDALRQAQASSLDAAANEGLAWLKDEKRLE